MQSNWIKVVFFVLGTVMLAGIAQVLLDPGLGTPDESRRTQHPAGFSAIPPRGWGGSVFYANGPTSEDYLRVAPERSTGRQPSIFFSKWHEGQQPKPDAISKPYTFQGQPATLFVQKTKSAWVWRINFERDGIWYRVGLDNSVEIDVEKGPLWPFLNSFRVERPIDLSKAIQQVPPSTISTTSPATAPAP